jgi:predicted MFS family arabinose efflux permease
VLIASICGFISPLTNNAPLASLPDMSRDLGVSIEKATLSVTLAM